MAARTREDDETSFGHAECKGPMGVQGRHPGAAGHVTMVVELAATYIIELFGTPFTVLWDYSDHFMNFQGRVCLDASARFGVLGLMIIYGALPLYNKFVHMKNQKVLNVIAWTVIAVFAIDWILRIPFGNNYTGPV